VDLSMVARLLTRCIRRVDEEIHSKKSHCGPRRTVKEQ
jgi:hypothetical protein